jgi:hypothetical protein
MMLTISIRSHSNFMIRGGLAHEGLASSAAFHLFTSQSGSHCAI